MSHQDRILRLLRSARVAHNHTERHVEWPLLIYGHPKKKHLRDLKSPTPQRYKKVLPLVDPPGKDFTASELKSLLTLATTERDINQEFILQADEDFVQLFRDLCEDLDVPFEEDVVGGILSDSRILITKIKYHHNRPRPFQVAEHLGVPFDTPTTKTGNSPSYPSGHTVQARLIAHYLTTVAPQYRDQFDDLAWRISWSRCQAGLHWPSDLCYGEVLARHLIETHPDPTGIVYASLSLRPDYGSGEASVPRGHADPSLVVAKYKEKKKVPKADGKGTTTVYEYSDRQVALRHREKAKQVEKLRKSMGDLRQKVRSDLTAKDPKKRLTALAVALMDETYERVGNSESAEERGHYGVTTWRVDHVTFSDSKATLKYTGKSGVKHTKEVTDAKVVKALREAVKGKSKDDEILCGEECNITAQDVNDYLDPFGVTAKDLRGYHANRDMQERLKAVRKGGPKLPEDKKEREKLLKEEFQKALEGTAEAVGHEASTLRSQYLVPGLEDDYIADGVVNEKLDKSANRRAEKFGPSTNLMERDGLKVRYRVKSDSGAIGVAVYAGRTNIGGMNAFVKKYPETDACAKDIWNLLERYPQVEDTSSPRWVTSDGVERTNTRALRVYKAFLTDESKHGLGIGRAMYLAVMAEWFNKVGPFLFMPYACSGSGTSAAALRVWKSLARDFPSSGNVIAVLRRPQLPSEMKMATKSDAEKEDEAAESLVRKQPKYRPPRTDLRQRRLDDDGEKDPDAEQDEKDRSHNWKDIGASMRVAYAYLTRQAEYQPKERRPGDVWQTEKGFRAIPQGGGDTRQFDTKPEADAYAKGPKTESEPKPKGEAKPDKEKPRSPEEIASSLLGKGDMPEEFQLSLEGWLDRSSPKDKEAFARAFESQLQTLVDNPPAPSDMRKSREPELSGKSPEDAALSAAKALYAERVTFNPFHGMSGSNTSENAEPNVERAKESYGRYAKYTEEDLGDMLDQVEEALQDETLKEGSARYRELEAEREALLLHRMLKGDSGDADAGLVSIAKVLAKSGKEDVLLGGVSDFTGPQGVAVLQEALRNMSDEEMIETFQDNPVLQPLMEVLSGKSSGSFRSQLDQEGAEILRQTLISQVVSAVVLSGPLGEALPKEGGSTVDLADRVSKNPKVKERTEAVLGVIREGEKPAGEVLELLRGLGDLKSYTMVQEARKMLDGGLTKITDPVLRARAIAIDNGEDPTSVLEAEMAKGLEDARKERARRDQEREQQLEEQKEKAEKRQSEREKETKSASLFGAYDFEPWT